MEERSTAKDQQSFHRHFSVSESKLSDKNQKSVTHILPLNTFLSNYKKSHVINQIQSTDHGAIFYSPLILQLHFKSNLSCKATSPNY